MKKQESDGEFPTKTDVKNALKAVERSAEEMFKARIWRWPMASSEAKQYKKAGVAIEALKRQLKKKLEWMESIKAISAKSKK